MNVTNNELIQAYKEEKNNHKKERLHAICMIKVNKHTIAETAREMFRTYQCVHNWLLRFEEYGLDDLSRSGRPPIIPSKKLEKIKRLFKKLSGGMTPKKLMQFIFDRTGIRYHITHVRRIIHSWNLRAKVPQKQHVNAASNKECSKRYKDIILRIKKAKNENFKILIQDESIFTDDVYLGKKYWVEMDKRLVIPWRGTHQRFVVHGMVSDDNQSFFCSYAKFNSPSFLDYLKKAHKKFGKIFVIADKAAQHRSKNIKNYLEKNNDVKLEYLPKGSPHLSTME